MPIRDVSVVIPSWNGRELLERCLPSVMKAAKRYREKTGAATETIVIDDGGSDDTEEWLRATYGREVLLEERPKQGGFAGACNTGLARAQGPIVLLLNNDVTISVDAMVHLVDHFDDPQVFAVTCKALEPESNVVASGGRVGEFRRGFWRVYRNYDVVDGLGCRASDYPSILASGGFSAFDLEKLRNLGGFNPLLSPFYWEDVDLSLRAWHRGWKINYEPRSEVRHAAGSTIARKFGPRQIRRVSERNRLIVHWIHVHETSRLLRHLLGLVGLLSAAILTFDESVLRGFVDAVGQWPKIRLLRKEERRARVISDRTLEAIFHKLRQRNDIRVFGSREEFLKLSAPMDGGEASPTELRSAG